jgi:hypothetical protein
MPDQPPVHDLGELERLASTGRTSDAMGCLDALPTLIAVARAAMDVDEAHMASMNEAPSSSPLGKLRAALRPFYGSDR